MAKDEAKVAAAKEAPKAAKEAKEEVVKAPRGIMLNVDGKETRRVDYIRSLWESKKYTRGEIRVKVSEIQGVQVPFQIIFAATKGLEGGAPKVEKPAKEAAPAKAEKAAKTA